MAVFKVSLESPIIVMIMMIVIDKRGKRWRDAKEIEERADGRWKDGVNEPVAANLELEHSSSNFVNTSEASAVTVSEKSLICFVCDVLISLRASKNKEVPNLS